MKKELVGLHSSPNFFDSFDLSKFRINCLDIDTNEFGIYFDTITPKNLNINILSIFMVNNAHYGLRHGNEKAYMYLCKLYVDINRFIPSLERMSLDEYKKLWSDLYVDDNFIEENYLTKYIKKKDKRLKTYSSDNNNQILLQNLIYYLIDEGYSFKEIAEYFIINHNIDGYTRHSSIGMGQMVFLNTQCIKIKGVAEYHNQREFMKNNIDNVIFKKV